MLNRPDPSTWTDPRHQLGWESEIAAGRWLVARGWKIEAHRFRLGRNDLDLVIRMGSLVAFVEVKARRTNHCGAGEEAIGPRKRAIIERLAWAWILRHGGVGDQYRFDAIALEGPPGKERVRHIEDAWRPGWR